MIAPTRPGTARPDLRSIAIVAAILAGGAAGVGLLIGVDLKLVVAGLAGLGGVIAILVNVEWGLYAVAAFSILRLADVATDFHGAPSTFQPLAAVIVVGLAVRYLTTGERPSGGMLATLLIATYLLVALASLLIAVDPAGGLEKVDRIARDAGIAVLVGVLLHRGSTLRATVWVIVGAAGFLGTITAYQFLTGAFGSSFLGFAQASIENIVDITDDYRISGPIGDANYYAQLLVMAIPLAIERMRSETSFRLRALAAAAAAAMTASVVFTFSRGGAVALLVVLGLMVAARPPRMRTVGAIAVVVVLALPFVPDTYMDRLTTITQVGSIDGGTDVSIRGRTAEMAAGFDMFRDHPLTGVGFGNYPANYVDYARERGIEQRLAAREPHSLYLEIAAETGLPGILAFGAIVLAAGNAIVTSRRRFAAAGLPELAAMSHALGVALMGYLVTSVILHMAFSRPFWLVIGIALALPAVATRETQDRAAFEGAAP